MYQNMNQIEITFSASILLLIVCNGVAHISAVNEKNEHRPCVDMALHSVWDFSSNSSPNSYNMLSLSCQRSCLQKACLFSLYLAKFETWAEAARETCKICTASGVVGGGRDIKACFSPQVFIHSVATVLESLLPLELSWNWNCESYRKPATCSINYWDMYSYSKNFLSFLDNINAAISNNYWVVLFTELGNFELTKTSS